MSTKKATAIAEPAQTYTGVERRKITSESAASPDVVLGLIAAGERWCKEWSEVCNENQVLINRNQALLEALTDAARSLETISKLAGRATYGNPPIDTYMQHNDEVRGYAASRSGVAFDAIKLAEGKDV